MLRTEENDSGKVFYFPPIKSFDDTGFVEHRFSTKAVINARVVPSSSIDEGADIELSIKDRDGKDACNITLDKFSALCLVDVLIKNLLNQEELEYERKRRLLERLNRGISTGGKREELGEES